MAIDWAAVSPWIIPEWAQLANTAQAAVPTSVPNMSANVGAGMSSPILQQILGPMMQRLQAPQQLQQQNLTDAFRSAGGLSSSAYGGAFNQLLQQQGQQGNDLMASVMSSILSPLMQSFNQDIQNQYLPANSLTNILKAGTPQVIGAQQTAASQGPQYSQFTDPNSLAYTGGGSSSTGGQGGSSGGGSSPYSPNQGGQLFQPQPTSSGGSSVGYGAGNEFYTGGSPTQEGGQPIVGPGSAWDQILQQLNSGGGLGNYDTPWNPPPLDYSQPYTDTTDYSNWY